MSDFQVGDIVAPHAGIPGNKPFPAARVTQPPERVVDNPLWMVLVEFDGPSGLQKRLVYTHNLVLVVRAGDYRIRPKSPAIQGWGCKAFVGEHLCI